MRAHAPKLLASLEVCISSESWPVRDTACLSIATLIKHFPNSLSNVQTNESISKLSLFTSQPGLESNIIISKKLKKVLESFFLHLQDPISSVREHASEGIGEILSTVNYPGHLEQDSLKKVYIATITFLRCLDHLKGHLNRAHSANKNDKNKIQFIPSKLFENMIQNSNKSNQNETENISGNEFKKDKKIKKDWGCFLDCSEIRKSGESDWEASEGCIYLFRELAVFLSSPSTQFEYNISMLESFLPDLLKLLESTGYKDAYRLHTTLYSEIPKIFACFHHEKLMSFITKNFILRLWNDFSAKHNESSNKIAGN